VAEAVIESVVFSPAVWDVPGPVDVVATMSDGTTTDVCRFFPDEIRFSAEELVGLTVEEAKALRHQRDVQWLQM
jgi:hypothetical protein